MKNYNEFKNAIVPLLSDENLTFLQSDEDCGLHLYCQIKCQELNNKRLKRQVGIRSIFKSVSSTFVFDLVRQFNIDSLVIVFKSKVNRGKLHK
jgi:hypothetical protein